MARGGWDGWPVVISGQEETCGPSLISHNSNPSAVFLPTGGVVLAYRYPFRTGSESVNVAVGSNISAFEALFPCNYTLTIGPLAEDPSILPKQSDGSLHMYYHCQRYGHGVPNSPGLHAFSRNRAGDGRDTWHTTASPAHTGAYSTVINLTNGSSSGTLFHRRERPELLFDEAGTPRVFYSALQETASPLVSGGWGYSFSFAQRVNGAAA